MARSEDEKDFEGARADAAAPDDVHGYVRADESEAMTDEPVVPTLDPAPARVSSTDVPAGLPAPRAARFGEGPEGRAARKERGVKGPRAGFFERIGTFWYDVRTELKRVSWPSLKEVQHTTIITIIAVIFFAIYLYVVDLGLAKLIEGLSRALGG